MNRRQFIRWGIRAGVICAAGGYSVFVERSIVLVNHYRIHLQRLPNAFEGFKIVHLTDLHHGFLVSLGFSEKVIQRMNSIPRDITVCTGDYTHERNATEQIDRIWPVLGNLRAPYGVYSVLGNHDHWGSTKRSLHWLEKSGQSLRRKPKCIEIDGQRLWLAGAGDLWTDHVGIDDVVGQIPDDECRIVLAHNPDTADTHMNKRVDLMISGHTHGGQVKIPLVGTPVLPVKNKNYSSGLKQSPKGFPVFISRGIGWGIYPIRFNCYPEIAVLELTKQTPA